MRFSLTFQAISQSQLLADSLIALSFPLLIMEQNLAVKRQSEMHVCMRFTSLRLKNF